MSKFIEFHKCKGCNPAGLRANLNFLSRCQVTEPRRIILDFSSFGLEVYFDPKTPKAEEFANHLMAGNNEIEPFLDSISKVMYYSLPK